MQPGADNLKEGHRRGVPFLRLVFGDFLRCLLADHRPVSRLIRYVPPQMGFAAQVVA
jgi:hypothetical protein